MSRYALPAVSLLLVPNNSSVYVVAGKAGIACLHGARAVSECASEHCQRPVGARLRHVRVRGRRAALCSRIPHPPGAGHHDSGSSPNTRCMNDLLLSAPWKNSFTPPCHSDHPRNTSA